MNSNIGLTIQYASQTVEESAASQIYLWCISRLHMKNIVNRSILARQTDREIKLVVAHIHTNARLECGVPVTVAARKYDVCKMLTRMFGGTFVYIRRKSRNVYQIVMSWNTTRSYGYTTVTPHFERSMQDAYEKENTRRLLNDTDYVMEMIEEERERFADMQQTLKMKEREEIRQNGTYCETD